MASPVYGIQCLSDTYRYGRYEHMASPVYGICLSDTYTHGISQCLSDTSKVGMNTWHHLYIVYNVSLTHIR